MSAPDTLAFPQPETDGIGAHHWTALADGRLEFQSCKSCNHAWLPPRTECPRCLGPDWAWQAASGKAKLVSWVVYHHGYHPWFAKKLPYNVAVVELAEGPRLISNILADLDQLKIDIPLQLVIQHEADVALARFRPV